MTSRIAQMHEFHFSAARELTSDRLEEQDRGRGWWIAGAGLLAAGAVAALAVPTTPALMAGPEAAPLVREWSPSFPTVMPSTALSTAAPASARGASEPGAKLSVSVDTTDVPPAVTGALSDNPYGSHRAATRIGTPASSDNPYGNASEAPNRPPSPGTDNPY